MSNRHDPERILVSSLDELEEVVRASEGEVTEVTVSYVMAWKLRLYRIVHPLGIHYLVPLKQFDPASRRFVDVGTTCWFC